MPLGVPLTASSGPGLTAMSNYFSGGGGGYGGGGMNQGLISNAINGAQAAQKKANKANEQRYQQGMGVLNQGKTDSSGLISQALGDVDKAGTTAMTRIGMNEANAHGSTAQNATSRGLGNFTIADSLQRGVSRDAEQARSSVDEAVGQQKSALHLQQANNTTGYAGNISQYIASRNDIAPNLGQYADLVRGAAGSPAGAMRTGTVTQQSMPSWQQPQVQMPTQPQQAGGYYTGSQLSGGYTGTQGATNPAIFGGGGSIQAALAKLLGNYNS